METEILLEQSFSFGEQNFGPHEQNLSVPGTNHKNKK
jgi:hypothetical protein